MEGIRADLDAIGNPGLGHQLRENLLGAALTDLHRCHGVLIARNNAQILELPAEHHMQRRVVQSCLFQREVERAAGSL